jgi:hypothetical protein
MEVAQSAEISDGHSTTTVELVTTNSVLDRWSGHSGTRLEPGLEGLEGNPTVDRSVRSLLVVVQTEGLQLQLKMSEVLCGRLPL